ncbi:DUF5666 domain-containing protein [Roseateles saccharophilus]|uniref:DUF5666 domain-containing protein n=1 Tax=Roseateles saccharophilus TaxID=304 RepID=A0A4V2VSV7_ROSSA|nr:DUF5666 domain-containing protein [Roseateles saccharophilus]MDG0832760.1 hypothetical protein [Roseateles saccharophilus]TCV03880.1 hypothetical protein EV671_1002142 [Roseateles saccharophilus]
MKQLKQHLQWGLCALSCALSAAVLVACGGGAAAGDTASQSPATAPPSAGITGVVNGTITGFGSVVINGVRYDDSLAKVAFSNQPDVQTAATLGDLHTGMQVQATLKDGALQNLLVNFALLGTIGAVDTTAGTLTVFGQTIKITTTGQLPTVFEGFSALSQLALGDLVKVSGTVASDGSITATRIERRLKDGTELFRISGAVQGLDTTAKTFGLTGNTTVTVDYSKAKVLPDGAVIENGKPVSVVSANAPAASGGKTVLVASAVEVRAKKLPDSGDTTVGGPISDFQSLASLRVGDVVVDASAATLKDGTVAGDIVNGAQALAHGTLSSGAMKADWIKVLKNDTAIKALLVGQITDYVSLANFTLRGTAVDGSAATFSKGSAADLGTGAWVTVTGQLTSSGVKATDIAVQPPPADKPQHLAGAITAVDATAKTFTVLGTTVQWSDTTKIAPDGKSLANLAAGVTVSVEGSYSAASGVFTATSVTVVNTTGVSKTIGFSGVAFNVTSTSLQIGSYTVQITPNTQLQPTGTKLADLVNGSRLSIRATVSGSAGNVTLTALAIELEKPEQDASGNDYVYLGGLIGDFNSAADFKVGSQKVDASGSTVKFIDGDASKLANGAKVEIKGSVKDGVLIAVQVHFMPG